MRQSAPLWDPDKPVHENEAYVARAKELEQQLEATTLTIRTSDGPIDDETNDQETTAQG